MEAHAAERTIRLADERVVIAGDWHENTAWAAAALHAAGKHTRTVLHVGDFGLLPGSASHLQAIDEAAAASGIDRILLTPGNHDDWGTLNGLFAAHPGCAVRVSETVWALPRAFTFHAGGRSFLSFGGAASPDFRRRTAGVDWWPGEAPTDGEVGRAIHAGWVDVMLTHDAVHYSGIPAVETIVTDPGRLDLASLDYVRATRDQVTRVYLAVGPTLLFHGHLHVAANGARPHGRRIYSLGADGSRFGNLALLDVADLTVMGVGVFHEERAAALVCA